jgi:hypothetical protein
MAARDAGSGAARAMARFRPTTASVAEELGPAAAVAGRSLPHSAAARSPLSLVAAVAARSVSPGKGCGAAGAVKVDTECAVAVTTVSVEACCAVMRRAVASNAARWFLYWSVCVSERVALSSEPYDVVELQ